MNKKTIDPGRLYRVRELAEILAYIANTALRWVQLEKLIQ